MSHLYLSIYHNIGTIDQFVPTDITDLNNSSPSYSNQQYDISDKMTGMRDPGEILLMTPSDDENDVYNAPYQACNMPQPNFQKSMDAQYRVTYQHHYNEPQNNDAEDPSQLPEMYEPDKFGYNPESLYSQDAVPNIHQYPGKENYRSFQNVQKSYDEEQLKKTKQKFHERLAKHRFVSNSGNKKCKRDKCAVEEPKLHKYQKKIQSGKPTTYMNPTLSRQLNLEDRTKLQAKAKRVVDEAENKIMGECSFKPEIHSYDAAEEELTQEERWRRLLEPKTSKIQKLEKTKFEQERKEVEET